ncbi:hypothetical protein O9929_28075 [Vibrio lentus]|nr:hypothetical protein [Vibrio lentus]
MNFYQGDVLTITEKLDENLVASEVEEHNAMAQLWIDQARKR